MKPPFLLRSLGLLLLGGVPLSAHDFGHTAASAAAHFARVRHQSSARALRLPAPRGGSPELALHYVRRGQATRYGLAAARNLARQVSGGKDFYLEILDWSYDGALDRFAIGFRLFWSFEHAPGRTAGLQGVFAVDADDSAPVFTRTHSFDARVPLPPEIVPMLGQPLAKR